jgi:hypothetical protein
MAKLNPHLGECRLAIKANESGKYLLWHYKRGGWEFETALTDIEASEFLEANTNRFLRSDAHYDYCHRIEHYSIYILIDPRDKMVRYVGISKDVKRRSREHLQGRSSVAVAHWVRELKAQGLTPDISIVEEDILGEGKAERREWYWCTYFLTEGAHLLNSIGPGIRARYAP